MTAWVGMALALGMAGQADTDPALKELHRLVGGKWKTGPVEQEFTAEDGAVRGLVTVGKGTAKELRFRSTMGWDARAKKTYYLDVHGGNTVYFGHVVKEGGKLRWDFESLTGNPSKWRVWTWFVGDDEYHSTMDQWKDGKWVPLHGLTAFKRVK